MRKGLFHSKNYNCLTFIEMLNYAPFVVLLHNLKTRNQKQGNT